MKKKKSKKSLFLKIAGAVILLLVIISIFSKGDEGIAVTLAYPQVCPITETVPANGRIQPVTEVKISPDVSGEIVELNCEEGDRVNAGDLLIKIKQDLYISAVEQAEASLNSVKAQYLQQKAQLIQIEAAHERNKSLFEQKAISQQELETSTSQYQVAVEQLNAAKYNIKSAEAALKEARENLVKTTIYAPMSGIISDLAVEKGERVVGTSQMAGTEMLRIADMEKMEVLVEVNENDIIRLAQSDTADIEVDAYPNRKFKGVVTHIANSANSTGGTVSADQVTNFEVKVKILPESYRDLLEKSPIPFRPGMSASVSIITDYRAEAIVIPIQAITTRTELADSSAVNEVNEFVFVYDSITGRVAPQVIKTGIQDMMNIEVLDGLTRQSRIVTGPYRAINRELKKDSEVTVH
ncbi:MAG: efflux RND transporter periplasmic adaptor subunit [Bacteroidetes bacterium]|uniref:Efflux RND transporter periplasmic adaptor subunit n=1 Tax=Candidatus Egerieousia excrementavium TaxID=2840778 RepID=A0A9D9GYY9_9BACT|nr:efflux RND transporter periplasmic adaptor subunit [Candidatus Egerieousia excrementavium]